MKKLTSILLTLCLIVSTFNMCALADGYGDSYGSVEDTLPDIIERDFDSNYAVAYNDFEGVSGFTSQNGFVLEDTGNFAYGNAIRVSAQGWGVPYNIINATYTWKGATQKVFNEAVTPGEDYILSYEYWSDPNPQPVVTNDGVKHNPSLLNGGAFSFAPQHDDFWTDDSKDHRDIPTYYNDNKWHVNSFAFTAGATEKSSGYTVITKSVNGKLNSSGTYIKSYLDNYLLMKAGEIIIDDASGSVTLEVLDGDFVMSNDAKAYNKKNTVALGSNIKFKLNSSNIGIYVSEVKMGDTVLTPDSEGVYSVKITDDIKVSVGTNTSLVTNIYPVDDNGNVYFKDKLTAFNFTDNIGAPASLINLTRNNAEIIKDVWLTANDKLSYVVGDVSYNVKYIGDVAGGGDGKWTVSDVVSMISNILGKETTELSSVAFDLNESGKTTVSDVVALRSKILNMEEVLSPDSEVTENMDAFIQDVLTRSGAGVTEQDLINGIYNYGDRTRIANVIRKAMRGEDIQIVYFGGSITATAGGSTPLTSEFTNTPTVPSQTASFTTQITASDTSPKYGYGYVAWVTKWFETQFPDIKVSTYNAGIGSTDSPFAVHRMVEDVLPYNPDLVINEWACNDASNYQYKQGTYEQVLKRLYDNGIAVLLYGFATRGGGSSQDLHKQVADYYDAPFVSYKDAFYSNQHYQYFTNDATHPNMVGHALAGATMNYYFQKVYEEIDQIGTEPLATPSEYFHPEAHYYEGAYIADLYDIANGEFEGVTIKDMGSFEWETSKTTFACRSYYGATAKYSESYEPMVIEIDACKTLFIVNKVSTGFNDGAYYIEVNGEKMTNTEFNCSKGKKEDQNPESGYHWATPRIMYDPDSPKVTLKIYPNVTENDPEGNNRVTLYSLLLS